MRKIPTVFVRDEMNRKYVTAEVTPGCEWVLKGEGVATRKYDGTCVMLDHYNTWWARREVKPGKAEPPGFMPVETDEKTGKTVGWEPIEQSAFAKYHAEAVKVACNGLDPILHAGTYELVGPKVNGNPEKTEHHRLIEHATATEWMGLKYPTDFDALRDLMAEVGAAEGIVWHHPDGRMAKLKVRDFPA